MRYSGKIIHTKDEYKYSLLCDSFCDLENKGCERGNGGGRRREREEGKREGEKEEHQKVSGDMTMFIRGPVLLQANEAVINPHCQLTKFSDSPLCLLRGRYYLKLLCVDPVLFHQLLALILMQVKMAYRHCTAGSGQLDQEKKRYSVRKVVFGPEALISVNYLVKGLPC